MNAGILAEIEVQVAGILARLEAEPQLRVKTVAAMPLEAQAGVVRRIDEIKRQLSSIKENLSRRAKRIGTISRCSECDAEVEFAGRGGRLPGGDQELFVEECCDCCFGCRVTYCLKCAGKPVVCWTS